MKLDLQTVANVFANRLGSNNRRVVSSPLPMTGTHADLAIPGAILRVDINQHLITEFTITAKDETDLSRAELAKKYADPAVDAIRTQFNAGAKDYIVSQELPKPGNLQATAEHNNMNVRVTSEDVNGDTKYTLEVLLGTFSI